MNAIAAAPAVPFAPPAIGPEEIGEVIAALESGWLSTGPRVHQFEEAFRRYVQAPHAIALNSCTAGLHLALLAGGIGPGDEVITSPMTFCATANVIVHVGATPVFADIEPETGNLDPRAVAAAVTAKTRALMTVHYAGRPANISALDQVARRHTLVTIEDAAHCIEGATGGRKVGSTADFTAFSFYATKNLTTGEGGLVTVRSAETAQWIRTASLHGMSRDGWARAATPLASRYDVVTPGFKYNMTDLQAAIGLHQLAAIERHAARRAEIWARYDDAIATLPVRTFEPVPDGDRHARHLYTILIDGRQGLSRDDVSARLGEMGIATSIHFPAVHLHTYYRERFGFRAGQFPEAERVADQVLSLPFSPALTDEQVDGVIAALRQVFRG
jgi:dTDP-4-amino-4,6-dideoxygalactose transaminase